MGAVKNWIMDLEEEFETEAAVIASECDSYSEYLDRTQALRAKVVHYERYEQDEMLYQIWQTVYEKYAFGSG